MRAVELALALMAAPRGLDEVRRRPLPEEVLAALKAAAGDALTLHDEAARYRCTESDVQEACAIFVQQVLLAEGNDPFRTLGCEPEADEDRLRQHYRWLQRWLHPDRDPEGWVSVFSDRVNAAWNQLKRRDTRDALRAITPRAALSTLPQAAVRVVASPWPAVPLERARLSRFLPHAVVGAILLVSLAIVWAHRLAQPVVSALPATPDPAPSTPAAISSPVATVLPGSVARAEDVGDVVAEVSSPTPVTPIESSPPTETVPVSRIATASPPLSSDKPALRTKEPPAPTTLGAANVAVADVVPVVEPIAALSSELSPTPTAIELPAMPSPTSAPLPVAEPEPVRVAAVPGPPEAPPILVLFAYRSAYQRGDTIGLMRLFTADARTPFGGWMETRDAFAALFARSEARDVALQEIAWQPDGDGWVGSGRIDVLVQASRRRDRQQFRGEFTVRLQPRAGTQRIVAWEQRGG